MSSLESNTIVTIAGTKPQYTNSVLKIYLLIIVAIGSLFFLKGGPALAEEPANVLKRVKEALAIANYHYGKPERDGRGFSGHKHLPEEVIKYVYQRDKERSDPIRIDYYTVPSIFNWYKEKFIAREIYLYDKATDDISYLVWTNEKDEIQWFKKKIPSRRISQDKKAGTEIRKVDFIHYDKNGIMTKRDEWVDYVNHKDKTATFIYTERSSSGELLSKESGDAVYGDVAEVPEQKQAQ